MSRLEQIELLQAKLGIVCPSAVSWLMAGVLAQFLS
ncbi:MAG: hypothetical protein M2R45_03725 [Verrucomicrobia subdivision 3 bacterium]|nr:hypothetical protein [Limisphaerales bacterium]MCS1416951.1 hypothetical protein [Limisphaerales bacterium]